MNHINWDNLEFINEDSFVENEVKGKPKAKKRKWREIESIKEKRRLKKQIEELEHYSF
jgi:hypothetical protein